MTERIDHMPDTPDQTEMPLAVRGKTFVFRPGLKLTAKDAVMPTWWLHPIRAARFWLARRRSEQAGIFTDWPRCWNALHKTSKDD